MRRGLRGPEGLDRELVHTDQSDTRLHEPAG
jgi:hypothetical protein